MTSIYQQFIDKAISEGIAPGLQAVLFNKDEIVFNGISGLSSVADEDSKEIEMKKETGLFIASCSKLTISIIALQILEKGLCQNNSKKTSFTLSDLDSHEKLISILPEFKLGSGSMTTKIFQNTSNSGSINGKQKSFEFKDSTKGCTLRHLLTHTNGLGYWFNVPDQKELFLPDQNQASNQNQNKGQNEPESEDEIPHFETPLKGNIQDFSTPLSFEPGENFLYGVGADWLGEFIVRSTGKNLRSLCKELVFEPLGLDEKEIDLIPVEKMAGMHVRVEADDNDDDDGGDGDGDGDDDGDGDGDGEGVDVDDDELEKKELEKIGLEKKFKRIPFEVPIPEDEWNPEKGKAWLASGPIISSLQTYSKILQATLNKDSRLLKKNTWDLAISDQTTPMGIKIQIPIWKTSFPEHSHDMNEFSSQNKPGDFGITLLQSQVFNSSTISGKPKGSLAWAGLANTYWFLDPKNGIGSMFGTQVLPFFDPKIVKLRDEWEKLIYSQIETDKENSKGSKIEIDSQIQRLASL